MCDRTATLQWWLSSLFVLCGGVAESSSAERELPELAEVRIQSTFDGSLQPALLWAPDDAQSRPTPLLIFLHSWSGDYRQKNDTWQKEAVDRGWIYLHPDFRGRNDKPAACGSKLARHDVLDARDYVLRNYKVDQSRIYLAGTSGGGHMAMLMAGYHPEQFSAVSAWVGISDLAAWHQFHAKDGQPQNYARMVAACCGGPPGASPQVDAEYRARSPLFHLHRTGDLPLDLNSGMHDGHTGSVPIRHTLLAFNAIATAKGEPIVTAAEIEQLSTEMPA